MARLTKPQRGALLHVLLSLQWTAEYIAHAETAVCRVNRRADATAAYAPNGASAPECYGFASLTPIDKEIGSPLCGLGTGLRALENFLKLHEDTSNV